jgi:hypothetical protein
MGINEEELQALMEKAGTSPDERERLLTALSGPAPQKRGLFSRRSSGLGSPAQPKRLSPTI